MNADEQRVFDLVRLELRSEYVPSEYRGVVNSQYCGHCHHATIAMYYLLDGKQKGYKVRKAIDEKSIKHYWLETKDGEIIDPTAEQYTDLDRPLPYRDPVRKGVSHLQSKAAKTIIANVRAYLQASNVET
jgi:hypothetical protein